jgi:hypothetical protein
LKGPKIIGGINEGGYIKESREKVVTNMREVCMGEGFLLNNHHGANIMDNCSVGSYI